MTYSKQTWSDGNLAYPLSDVRMGHIEDGIETIDETLDLVKNRVDILGLYPGVDFDLPLDGTTDATAELVEAATAANGAPIWLPSGLTVVLNDFTLAGIPVNLRGNAILKRTDPVAAIIRNYGTLGTSVSLTANATAGDVTLTMSSTAGLAAGDVLFLRSTAVWGASTANLGEQVVIYAVTSGTVVTLVSPIRDTYTTAASAVISKPTLLTGVNIDGPTFYNDNSAQFNVSQLVLRYCVESEVNAKFVASGKAGVELDSCRDFDVRARCLDFRDQAPYDPGGYAGAFGYGVFAFGNSTLGDVYVVMRKGRHAFTTDGTALGVPRHVTVRGQATGMTAAAFDTHEAGEYITFEGCHAFNNRDIGIQHRCKNGIVKDCVVRGSYGTGVHYSPTASGEIDGVTIDDTKAQGTVGQTIGGGGYAMLLASTTPIQCDRVRIDGADAYGINCASSNHSLGRVRVRNTARVSFGPGIVLQNGITGIIIDSPDLNDLSTDIFFSNAAASAIVRDPIGQSNNVPTITPAASVALKATRRQKVAASATVIDTLTNPAGLEEVALFFVGVSTITEAGNIRLVGTASFVSTADDMLTLGWDGTNWFERSRSVN